MATPGAQTNTCKRSSGANKQDSKQQQQANNPFQFWKSLGNESVGSKQQQLHQQHNQSAFSYDTPHAFIVCGYLNFDTKAHPQVPSIGARIVAVNDGPVNVLWTMTEFTNQVKGGTDAGSCDDTPLPPPSVFVVICNGMGRIFNPNLALRSKVSV